jgi:hypothetical protein
MGSVPAERVPLEVHLDPLSAGELAMWDRFRVLIDDAGPSEVIVTKSRIAFKAHRIFAGGFFAHRRLEIFFDLPEPVAVEERDRRFRAVWSPAEKLWTHRLKLENIDDLDTKLAGWLKQSWSVYSRPPAQR